MNLNTVPIRLHVIILVKSVAMNESALFIPTLFAPNHPSANIALDVNGQSQEYKKATPHFRSGVVLWRKCGFFY